MAPDDADAGAFTWLALDFQVSANLVGPLAHNTQSERVGAGFADGHAGSGEIGRAVEAQARVNPPGVAAVAGQPAHFFIEGGASVSNVSAPAWLDEATIGSLGEDGRVRVDFKVGAGQPARRGKLMVYTDRGFVPVLVAVTRP